MTKTEAKKVIREHYKVPFKTLQEKIIDWNLWLDNGEYMYTIITISKNHIPYSYSGYFEGNKIHSLYASSGLLTVSR